MRRRIIGFTALIFLACIIQVGWLWPAQLTALTFSLSLVLITIVAFVWPWPHSLWYGLAQGLLIDLFSPYLFGTYGLTSMILAICIGVLQDTWLKQHSLLSVATITGTSLLLAQGVLLGLIEFTEFTDIITSQSVMAVTVAHFVAGLFVMVFCTLCGVRLLSRQYVKLI